MENEHIARLIYKCIVGMTLLPEESAELEQWRKADPKHEETYRRLLDPRFLEREYRRMNAVDPVRPMADMQARIRKEMRPRRRMRWATTLAFVASMAAMFCIGYFWDRPLHEVSDRPSLAQQLKEASIVVGKTQAVLTTPGGEELALNDDAEHNMRLMADNRTGEKTHEARINKLTTPRGGEFKITLEDSTEVWLNAESQLVYPEKSGTLGCKIDTRLDINEDIRDIVRKNSLVNIDDHPFILSGVKVIFEQPGRIGSKQQDRW